MGKKLTKEIFIERSIEKHGSIFDYSKVIFKNTKTKVEIVCNDHGSFYQPPGNHMMGQKCPSCSGRPKITTKTFIENSRIIHGNKYDYSKVNYVNNKTKVEIICKNHGIFKQIPSSHLSKRGCPNCVGRNVTTKNFIEKSRLVHGDRYDYSKVNYINSQTNVTVICKIHGEFYPRPGNHTNSKSGCPKCSIIEQHEKQKKTTEEFIKDSIKVHGDKYDYSKVNYVNNQTKVTIICNIHGEFDQSPNDHSSRGSGCPKCSIIEQHEKQKKTTEEFIKDSIKVHGDKYDYSKVIYRDSNTKVNIVCKIHGVFNTDPVNHVYSESGCPQCSEHGFNIQKKSIFYIRKISVNGKIGLKYGITNQMDGNRENQQKRGMKRFDSFETIYKSKIFDTGEKVLEIENIIKTKFGVNGFFNDDEMKDGWTETIPFNKENLNYIKLLIKNI